jgi:hypothetical protein
MLIKYVLMPTETQISNAFHIVKSEQLRLNSKLNIKPSHFRL